MTLLDILKYGSNPIHHSHCVETYYWKIDNNRVKICIFDNIPYSMNNIVWKTSKYCHCSIERIENEIGIHNLSTQTIYLN